MDQAALSDDGGRLSWCRRRAVSQPERRRRPPGGAGRERQFLPSLFLYGVVLLVGIISAFGLAHDQRRSDQILRDRFDARSRLSAGFVATFAAQVLERERRVGERLLAGEVGSRLEPVVAAFGFEAALLVGPEGTLLMTSPATDRLRGTSITDSRPYLRSAVAGEPTVSDVLRSAVNGAPVVAFAAPFETATGRRVLSGTYAVSNTPLHDYLKGISSLVGFQAFIVDKRGNLVASSGNTNGSIELLKDEEPTVAEALGLGRLVTSDGRVVFGHAVVGTSWQLVTDVPESVLLAPTRSRNVWQWTGLSLLILIALFACWLGLRLHSDRRQLRAANARLDAFAHLDGLTGLNGRRRLDELLASEHQRCSRLGSPLAALLIDVDHFKNVNDAYGHGVGDEVLRAIAERLRNCTREDDSLGRWGGEEFLVLLPLTSTEAALAIANRMRRAVSGRPIDAGTGGKRLTITVSIGCCSDTAASPSALIHAADRALYAAKATGRDRVVAQAPNPSGQRDTTHE